MLRTLGACGKEPTCQHRRCKRCGINSRVERIPWRKTQQPLQYSCRENPMDRGAWPAMVLAVAKTQTWLKRFSTRIPLKWRLIQLSGVLWDLKPVSFLLLQSFLSFFFNFLKVLAVVKYTNKTYHLMICKHIVQQCLYIHCCATNLQKFFILQNQNIKPIK